MAIATKMDDLEIRNHLDFLGSTESDTAPLRSLKPSANTPILEFIKDFYDDLFRNPDFAPIVRPSAATQDRLEDAPAGYARRTSTVTPTWLMETAGLPLARPTPGSTPLNSGPTPSNIPATGCSKPPWWIPACQGIWPNPPMPQEGAIQFIKLGVFYRPTKNNGSPVLISRF